jgi:hypothetical protein
LLYLLWLDTCPDTVASKFASTFQLYIVYMGQKKHDDPSVVTASHHDVLASVLGRYCY